MEPCLGTAVQAGLPDRVIHAVNGALSDIQPRILRGARLVFDRAIHSPIRLLPRKWDRFR